MGEEDRFFAGNEIALRVYRRVAAHLKALGPFETRVTKSQVAFHRRRGFAYLWLPRTWLRDAAPVVLSFAFDHRVESPRWKEVVHVLKGAWMHHLEMNTAEDFDQEVEDWLRDAYQGSG